MNSANARVSPIVIDEKSHLVFDSEEMLLSHFKPDIDKLEKEYLSLRSSSDVSDAEMEKYITNLDATLEKPDEIWKDHQTFEGQEIYVYIKEFGEEGRDDSVFHVAVSYVTEGTPSFVYLHFPTRYLSLVERYQRGEIIFDRILNEAPVGAIEGDALLEGDELALGMYKAMLKVRSESDIPEEQFKNYAQHREETIEEADEIWRNNDSFGNTIVNFVKEISDEGGEDLYYIVSTIEDAPSNTHALMFSFPTKDKTLISRYRLGENLQADEVTQESSH